MVEARAESETVRRACSVREAPSPNGVATVVAGTFDYGPCTEDWILDATSSSIIRPVADNGVTSWAASEKCTQAMVQTRACRSVRRGVASASGLAAACLLALEHKLEC